MHGPDETATTDDSTTTILELRQVVRKFVEERQWEKFHNAKNLSMSLAVEAAELMEHFQWLTSDEASTLEPFAAGQTDKQMVAEELADVMSYAFAIANVLDVDISQTLLRTMEKNRKKYPIDSPLTAAGKPTPRAP